MMSLGHSCEATLYRGVSVPNLIILNTINDATVADSHGPVNVHFSRDSRVYNVYAVYSHAVLMLFITRGRRMLISIGCQNSTHLSLYLQFRGGPLQNFNVRKFQSVHTFFSAEYILFFPRMIHHLWFASHDHKPTFMYRNIFWPQDTKTVYRFYSTWS